MARWLGIVLSGWVLLSCGGGVRGEEVLPDRPPESALVVFDHEGKTVALRLEHENQIAVMESCFPNYRTRPAGEGQAMWKPKYEIYFNFSQGRTVRVFVSSNSRYWSAGQGAIELRGAYFNNLVHELIKELSRGGTIP